MSRIKDITGVRSGKLIALEFVGINAKGYAKWKCACDCGKEKITLSSCILRGNVRSCGCMVRESAVKRNGLAKGESGLNSLYTQYKISARKRRISFLLSKEEFKSLVLDKCFYCGEPPSRKVGKGYAQCAANGVDRISSSGGYSFYNCRTACSDCNYMKHWMPEDDFLSLIAKIYNNHFQKQYVGS